MLSISVRYGSRKLTINVPKGVDEITVEVPQNGGRGQDEEKPLIILTDRT